MAEMNLKEWYEPTPADWSIQRMKNIMSPREDKSINGEEELLSVTINEGIIKRSEYLDEDEGTSRADSLVGYKVVSPTNLVNNIMKMSFRCLGVSSHEGIVSPAYSVFELNHSKVDPTYLNFLLRIDRYIAEYRKLSKGIQESRMRLYDDFFLAMKVVVPPLYEQKLISRYLDQKIEKIDLLVDKIRQRKNLIKESIRTHLFEVKLKNIKLNHYPNEWFQNVPDGWEIVKFRQLFEPIKITNNPPTERLLSVTQDKGVVFRDEQERDVVNPGDDVTSYKLVEPGDVIISLRSADGGLEISDVRGLVSPAYIVLKPKLKIDRNFYRFYLHLGIS